MEGLRCPHSELWPPPTLDWYHDGEAGQGSQLQKPRASEGPWIEIFVEGCHQHVDPNQQESGSLAGSVRPILSRSHCLSDYWVVLFSIEETNGSLPPADWAIQDLGHERVLVT